jgi:hypothetical protein
MPVQYAACKFRPEDSRAYTYEWDGEPLRSGDIVKVADKRGDGWKRVTVVSVTAEAPPYDCKQVLGLYNPDVEPDAPAEKPSVNRNDVVDADGDDIDDTILF